MSEPGASALYVGRVMHQRLRPLRHRLEYRVFSMLIDIDELQPLHQRLRWFSLGRFNLFSFWPGDHGDGTAVHAAGLRGQIQRRLQAAGLPSDGAVRLLAMPRILGYAFNPLSIWFCHAPDGALQAIIHEVNNTFGERHSYLFAVNPADRAEDRTDDRAEDQVDELIEQQCDKRLYVSPFLGMDLHYRFRIAPPQQRLSIGISVHEGRALAAQAGDERMSPVLNARLDASRMPLTDAALLRVFMTHPLLTLKVIGGIHWEALRLWLKGARLHARPTAPVHSLTIVRPGESTSGQLSTEP